MVGSKKLVGSGSVAARYFGRDCRLVTVHLLAIVRTVTAGAALHNLIVVHVPIAGHTPRFARLSAFLIHRGTVQPKIH